MNTETRKSFAYCIDTNLLVEFVTLEDIPWKTLEPTAEVVRIIVPTKVGEEMDDHKKKSGRLRRRATEFSQLSRRIEDSNDGVVVLREVDPRVTIEFGPLFRKSDLDADQFDLDDNDNRIVAEAFAIARNVPNLVLLSDDSKPIRLARQAKLACRRPLADWRRKEGPDERDTDIADLKRQIGAQPSLTATIVGNGAHKELIIEDRPESADPACTIAFLEAVLEGEPPVLRKELIEQYGVYSPNVYDFGTHLHGAPGLTNSQLSQYESEYQQFKEKSQQVANSLYKGLSHLGFGRLVEIDVGNDGDRAGEKVLVEVEVGGSFRFLPTNSISKQLKTLLEAPTPPTPESGLVGSNYHGINLKDRFAPPRIDIFHEVEKSELIGQSVYLSWRCEELRQGAHFNFSAFIVSELPEARGLLTITVSSAVIARKTILRVPLNTQQLTQPAGPTYFLQRLQHIPKVYRERYGKKLEALLKAERE
jgi:hypothetical protein